MDQISIAFTSRQHKALAAEAKRLGISIAELVRRILDQYLDKS
jgi:hypothetical protein